MVNLLLLSFYGYILTQGKGSMQTYWLMGKGKPLTAVSWLSLKAVEQSAGLIDNMMMDMTPVFEEKLDADDNPRPAKKRFDELNSHNGFENGNHGDSQHGFVNSNDNVEERSSDGKGKDLWKADDPKTKEDEVVDNVSSTSSNDVSHYLQLNGSKSHISTSQTAKAVKTNRVKSTACQLL